MFTEELSFDFQLHLRLSNIFGCVPFEWNSKENGVRLIKSKWKLFKHHCCFIFHLFMSFTSMLNFFSIYISNDWTASEKLQGSVFCSPILSCIVFILVCRLKSESLLGIYDGMSKFEARHYKGQENIRKRDKCAIISMKIALPGYLLPGLISVMLAVKPCIPGHFGAIMFRNDETGICDPPSLSIRWPILIIETGWWAIMIPNGIYSVFNIYIIFCRCIGNYLNWLGRSTLQNRKWTSMPLVNAKSILIYKQLQVLEHRFNDFGQSSLTPVMMTTAPMTSCFALFVTLRMHSKIAMPGFLFFPVIVLEALTAIIFAAHIGAQVLIESQEVLKKWNRYAATLKETKKRWLRKTIKSLPRIKIGIGSVNFVDTLTTLVMLEFIANNTISLLLMS